ncbi:flagellar hook protein FlgE [Arenibaculum pallidiluteum]|uniref:flagellar hook protein FlgE n=1 Tax=Arenibaculum pallidiluteum TaxID=2812559 RepID=UPI001A97BE3D|nr:flagellar hook protein FlgE [Arenibaculum pallidiluteum]
MSLFTAMRSGVSGMAAQGSRLAAISDNISNSATVGYKRADVDFSTLMTAQASDTTYAAGGVASKVKYDIGTGGAIVGTGVSTDMAISGNGFFMVASQADAAGGLQSFALTRAGRFEPDDAGYLRNTAGQYLQGWPLTSGALPAGVRRDDTGSLVSINVAGLTYQGSASKTVDYSANLPAQAAVGDTFSTTSSFYDGLGNAQELTLTWTNTGPNTWSVGIAAPGYTVSTPTVAGITFNATGPSAGLPTAAIPPITLTRGADTVTLGMDTVTQFNGDYVPVVNKDGAKAGQVSGVKVDEGGKVWVTFDNGASQALFQVPVATVTNPNGLTPMDGNTYALSNDSGSLFLADAGSGKAGEIQGGAVEQANVDIAEELVSLIETQRAYSSNAKIVQTADEMMEEVTRLKR